MSEPELIHVKPASPQTRVHTPEGFILDAAGATVTWSAYWQRRIDDGSVKVIEPKPEATGKK